MEYAEGKNQNKLREGDIKHIINVYDAFKDSKRYSKVVLLDEIRKNDYNLNIRRYADTLTAKNIFDVKAILRGGIPVVEVENEYIQETLNGMDVSCVFVRRNSDYYDFQIWRLRTKEQIKRSSWN